MHMHTYRKHSTYLIAAMLILFIALSVFAFTLTDPDMGHVEVNCVASMFDALMCPMYAAAVALHHIAAFGTFSHVVVPLLVSLTLLFLVAAFARSLVLMCLSSTAPPVLQLARARSVQLPSQKHPHIGWIFRLEHSPSL